MELTVEIGGSAPIRFECADNFSSRWCSSNILAGRTYPDLPFVDDVQVIFDIGANCGAATRYFAHHHPHAVVHAFEPGSEPRAFLERNVAGLPNVTVHPIGLGTTDGEVPLFSGAHDSITGSTLYRPSVNLEESEPIQIRAAGPWAAAHGIDRIDLLKLDVEGTEIEVLESLAALIPSMKVIYVEYDSRQARRDLGRLLDATHEFYLGAFLTLDQGECIYLRSDLADHPDAKPFLLERFLASADAGS